LTFAAEIGQAGCAPKETVAGVSLEMERAMNYRTQISLAVCCMVVLGMNRVQATVPASSLPNVDLLTGYAEFGNQEDESLVTINGNVGVSSNGTLHVFAPSVINGDVYIDAGATFHNDKSDNSNIHGTIFTGLDLSATQDQVFSASSGFSSLAADQSFGTLNSAQNFSATAGTAYVVDVGSLSLNNVSINFTGAGYLVLNVTNAFSLGGTAAIVASDPTHVFVNYTGTSALQTHVGDSIDGYLFIPSADATLDGTFFGGLYGGEGTISLMSGAVVTNVVPEPMTASLFIFGMLLAAGLGIARRRRHSHFV
jgi:hypothetical protein